MTVTATIPPRRSVESARVTFEEKAAIGDKVLSCGQDVDYVGEGETHSIIWG